MEFARHFLDIDMNRAITPEFSLRHLKGALKFQDPQPHHHSHKIQYKHDRFPSVFVLSDKMTRREPFQGTAINLFSSHTEALLHTSGILDIFPCSRRWGFFPP